MILTIIRIYLVILVIEVECWRQHACGSASFKFLRCQDLNIKNVRLNPGIATTDCDMVYERNARLISTIIR